MAQIKIQDLFPLLKPGFVAMDSDGAWWWYNKEPSPDGYNDSWTMLHIPPKDCSSLDAFDIAPYDGNWKNSLMECGK